MDMNSIRKKNNSLYDLIRDTWWYRLRVVAVLADEYGIDANRIRVFNNGEFGEVRISVADVDGRELPDDFIRDSEYALDSSCFYGLLMDIDPENESISLLTGC